MAFRWFWQKKQNEISKDDLDQVKDDILDGIKGYLQEGAQKVAPKFVDYEEEDEELDEDLRDLKEAHYDAEKSPWLSAVLSNNTLTVMTKDNEILSTSKGSKDLYKKVLRTQHIEELKALMAPEISAEERQIAFDHKKKALFVADVQKLIATGDFYQEGSSLFMKGIKLSLPEVMVKAFVEVEGRKEAYNALTNFWYWLSLNPNPESREDLYKFIEHNEVKITPMGLLVLYRRIVSKGKGGTYNSLVSFASTNYAKIKMKKKSPKNFYIAQDDNKNYRIIKAGQEYRDDEELVGSVYEVYHNLGQEESNEFTDAHTRKMSIKVGSIYSIPEEQVDRSNLHSCSQGLHVASRSYNYSGFGDTPVMALVNPSKVRAVPVNEYGKMRVSEMFIVAVLEIDKNGQYMDEDVDLVHFDEEYFNISVDELEKMAKSVNIVELAQHNLLPQVSMESIGFITSELKSKIAQRVVQV